MSSRRNIQRQSRRSQPTASATNAAPTTTSTSPTGNDLLSGQQTVLVNGTGFVNGSSSVYVDGVAMATTFVNSTQLSATFVNTLHWLTSSSSRSVTVVTSAPGGGTSNAQSYSVTTPTEIKGWWRADIGTTIVTNVSAWNDASSNGINFAQATGANQPVLNASGGANNQAFIRFGGSPKSMASSAITLAQPFETLTVLRCPAWTSTAVLYDGHGASNRVVVAQIGSTPAITVYAGTAFAASNTNLAVNTWGRLSAKYNGVTSSLAVNATAATTGNAGTHGFSGGGIKLGSNYLNSSFSQVDYADFVLVAGLTAGQRTEYEAYTLSRYGL